jgi:hypothetical protein
MAFNHRKIMYSFVYAPAKDLKLKQYGIKLV